jgi:hypothetical protein
VFVAVLCDLWFSRNKDVHEGIVLDAISLANTIKKTSLEHATAWKSCSLIIEVWSPYEASSFKTNFDMAINDNFSAQVAVVQRLQWPHYQSYLPNQPSLQPYFGEALATLFATSLTVTLKLNNFSIEWDSLIGILALQHPSIS